MCKPHVAGVFSSSFQKIALNILKIALFDQKCIFFIEKKTYIKQKVEVVAVKSSTIGSIAIKPFIS